jgi:hypothetical protein
MIFHYRVGSLIVPTLPPGCRLRPRRLGVGIFSSSLEGQRLSSGRYRPGLTPRGGPARAALPSGTCGHADRSRWSTDSCPGQRVFTGRSTPFSRGPLRRNSGARLTYGLRLGLAFRRPWRCISPPGVQLHRGRVFPSRMPTEAVRPARLRRSRIQASKISCFWRESHASIFLPFPRQWICAPVPSRRHDVNVSVVRLPQVQDTVKRRPEPKCRTRRQYHVLHAAVYAVGKARSRKLTNVVIGQRAASGRQLSVNTDDWFFCFVETRVPLRAA